MGLVLFCVCIFTASITKADLVAHWSCDEFAGSNILNDSVGSADGTLVGSRVDFVPSLAGIFQSGFGNALWTDNLDDYVILGDLSMLDFGQSDFTVTGWFKSNNSARHGRVIVNGQWDAGGFDFLILKNNGRFQFTVFGDNGNNKYVFSDEILNDDQWHWFAGVISNSKLYLYINGRLQSDSGVSYSTLTTADAPVGEVLYINKDTAASVDEIKIYDSALTTEVEGDMLIGGDLYQDWQNIPVPQDCNQAWVSGYGLTSDINKDCTVDIEDLAIMLSQWLGTINKQIPVFWKKPVTFNPDVSGLGMEVFGGAMHSYIYDPLPSAACLDEGGDGHYESVAHGTYNHHPQLIQLQDKLIAYWTNHAKDENGPGERMLAKIGTFNTDMTEITWGGNETIVEIAPQPVLVNRRTYEHDPALISEIFVKGMLEVIDGKIYSIGDILAIHGWTDDPVYHGIQYSPVPIEHWSDEYNSSTGFTLDVWWKLGKYYQRWVVVGNSLEPNTPLYISGALPTQVEVTSGNFRNVANFLEPYSSAPYFATALWEFRNDVQNGVPYPFTRTAYFSSESPKTVATDGINGLAHIAVFQRPDGNWVAIRDNLLNPGYYYAAMYENYDDYCPPASKTNLYGTAQADARELPDGRPYIVGNSIGRKDMFITISEDGFSFDKTWLLLHSDRTKSDDGLFKHGGPQYFRSLVVEDNIWVVYSITKELIGLTKVPVGLLN